MASITVTTADLRAKLQELTAANTKFKTEVTKMDSLKDTLASSWEGDASEAFKTKYGQQRPYFDTFSTTIAEYISKCETIIGNYEKAESTNQSIAK